MLAWALVGPRSTGCSTPPRCRARRRLRQHRRPHRAVRPRHRQRGRGPAAHPGRPRRGRLGRPAAAGRLRRTRSVATLGVLAWRRRLLAADPGRRPVVRLAEGEAGQAGRRWSLPSPACSRWSGASPYDTPPDEASHRSLPARSRQETPGSAEAADGRRRRQEAADEAEPMEKAEPMDEARGWVRTGGQARHLTASTAITPRSGCCGRYPCRALAWAARTRPITVGGTFRRARRSASGGDAP